MKKHGLFSRWFILPVVLTAMVVVFILGNTWASFNDIETSVASTAAAWTSTGWNQTSQTDFNNGVLSSVNTSASPGDVILTLTSVNTTGSPTTNTGSAWTSPTNAYADGGGTATITSGNPSGSNVWGNYGFALSGNITSVRVRYDAWSTGGVSKNQSIVPTADYSVNQTWAVNPTSPTTRWDKVDDPIGTPDAGTTFITGQTNGGGDATFTNTFNIPAGSMITNLVIYFRASDNVSGGGVNAITATLVIGGTNRRNTTFDNPAAAGTWTTYNRTYTTNPATGAAWTVDQINGVGANALNAFGVGSNDFNPDISVTQVYAAVNYTTANDEQIKIDVSWDGGTSWSSVQTTNLTASETTNWYDVTSATTWTPAKLADGQLQVRALAQTVGDNGTVSLDWLPVEVTYVYYVSSGTIASQVLDTNVTGSRWDGLAWDRTLLAGTNITFEVRASDTAFLKTDATPSWTAVGGTSPVISGLPAGRYQQWRATLSTANVTQTPVLNEVRVYYYGG